MTVHSQQQAEQEQQVRQLPPAIWALGLVSLLMDLSSELIHSLLPLFLATVLGASMSIIGLIEGVAEATAAISKLLSGLLSDRLGRRKLIVVAGYSLSALSKPLFPLASSVGWVFVARFADRIGKGIRGAPRDALIADLSPASLRGKAYGLRQALDSAGAFLGPMLALVCMALLADDITAVMWIAVIPAALAVLLLITAVREPDGMQRGGERPTLTGITELPKRFWIVVLFASLFILARFSEAFLLLRAADIGMTIGYVPVVMVLMNIAYATIAYPAGASADRLPPRRMLLLGLATLITADAVLALAEATWEVLTGAMLWGAHMGLTQGLLAKLVADESPIRLRATAFGLFHLVTGIALLLASMIAGLLWDRIGPAATFTAGAIFAAIAAASLLLDRGAGR